MELFNTLAVAITGGSALGATIAAFFAYRQKSLVTVLRESNNDYMARVKQLEDERKSDKEEMGRQADKIAALENERRLPLEELTKLILEQHAAQISSAENLTKQVGEIAKATAKLAREINQTRGSNE